MTKRIQGIYSNGVPKPIQPLEEIEEYRHVQVTVLMPQPGKPSAGWRGGLSDEDAAGLLRAIEREFEGTGQDYGMTKPSALN